MAKKPMNTPGAPAASRMPVEITSATRNPIGTEAYRLVDDASATDVRKGMTEAKKGSGKTDDANMSSAAIRPQVSAQATLGAQYHIVANRGAQTETYPGTLGNSGRIMRPAVSRTDEFYGDAAAYGPLGPR
jgi:hypothetical protein